MAVVTGQSAVRSCIFARSLGYRDDQLDIAALSTLEATYWTPRGEYFDHRASSDSTSAKRYFGQNSRGWHGVFSAV